MPTVNETIAVTAQPIGQPGPPGHGFNHRGDWQPDTEYEVDDTVTYLGDLYRVTDAHTSPGTFDGIDLDLIVARGEQGDPGVSNGVAVLSGGTTTIVTPVPTPSAPTATLLPGNRIYFLGDSITALGDNNGTNNNSKTAILR
jgi:hypothetical protein